MNEIKIPNHVALIVDGNGRWATSRGLSRSKGHEEGMKNIMQLAEYIYSKGVIYLSAYLFSTENFKREKKEVDFIMNLLKLRVNDILNFCHKNKLHVLFSGRYDNLSKPVINVINQILKETEKYEGKYFNICFNYGSRAEIVDAVNKIINDNIKNVDENIFEKYLYNDIPSVDLLIRTSGEIRLSNFMLWQLSYAELYFTKTLFPDFKEKDFDLALLEYTKRDRRFGGIKNAKENN